MTERKFVSISSVGSNEDGYRMLAVAEDGTAWVSEVSHADENGTKFEAIEWTPILALPAKGEEGPYGMFTL